MKTLTGGDWSQSLTNNYMTSYKYDANGNIEYLSRNDHHANPMDQLDYTYSNSLNNQLTNVDDRQGAAVCTDDFEHNTTYDYDEIGNLTSDTKEEIDIIEWTVSGKVKKVIRASGSSKANLEFMYDAMGNRIMKKVIPDITNLTSYSIIWYSRDASGNVMATYSSPLASYGSSDLILKEFNIYGSSRLGMLNIGELLVDMDEPDASIKNQSKGRKFFELSNHLGNVLAVVTDRLHSTQDGSTGNIASYSADLVTSSDYYPFGMKMEGRGYLGTEYRYGFNGKEKDPEGMGGGGNTYDYGFRIYNSQIAKFLSIDPLTGSYPWYTPYQFAGNKPIWAIDIDGLEEFYTTKGELIYSHNSNGVTYIVSDDYLKMQVLTRELIRTTNPTNGEVSYKFQYVYKNIDYSSIESGTLKESSSYYHNLMTNSNSSSLGNSVVDIYLNDPERYYNCRWGCTEASFKRTRDAYNNINSEKFPSLGSDFGKVWNVNGHKSATSIPEEFRTIGAPGAVAGIGMGSIIYNDDILSGKAQPGSSGTYRILGVESHSFIFIGYSYDDDNNIDGINIWDHYAHGPENYRNISIDEINNDDMQLRISVYNKKK